MVEYGRLISQNINVLNGIVRCFWTEIFSEGSQAEILFWINTPLRQLTISDLFVISNVDDHLFQIGLSKHYLNLDDAEDVIEVLEERLEEEDNAIAKSFIRNRIALIRNLLARQ